MATKLTDWPAMQALAARWEVSTPQSQKNISKNFYDGLHRTLGTLIENFLLSGQRYLFTYVKMEHRVIVATGFGLKGKRKEKEKKTLDGARSASLRVSKI
jgi:hypothetical protein